MLSSLMQAYYTGINNSGLFRWCDIQFFRILQILQILLVPETLMESLQISTRFPKLPLRPRNDILNGRKNKLSLEKNTVYCHLTMLLPQNFKENFLWRDGLKCHHMISFLNFEKILLHGGFIFNAQFN